MTISEYTAANNKTLPKELAALLNADKDVWSNEACYGYCIKAMENAGYSREQIGDMIHYLHSVFEERSVSEAEEYFHKW